MLTRGNARLLLWGFAGLSGAWWLLRQMQCTRSKMNPISYQNHPNWNGRRRPQPDEYWLDDTIEASFPASDPSSSTPLLGTGRRTY